MIYNIRPTVDMVFKKIFASVGNVDLLRHFLESVLGPYGYSIEHVTVKNPYNERDFRSQKMSVVDIKAEDDSGRNHQIEIQIGGSSGLVPRILFTWAGIYSKLLGRGRNYDELKPVISIWVLQGRLFARKITRHFRFRLWDTKAKQLLTDHLDIHVLQLQSRAGEPKIVDDEVRWLYFLRFGHRLDDENLPGWLDTPFIRRAMAVIKEIRESEETYEQYEARLKGERWYNTLVAVNKREKREARLKIQQARQERRQAEQERRQAEQEKRQARQEVKQLTGKLEKTEQALKSSKETVSHLSSSLNQMSSKLDQMATLLKQHGIMPPDQ
ncbi:MAG: Rpn family recombination-promoting nuclease/putative transposase [Acidobacteriota bacterium]|nr:Rpn family recombination-promoting nuclease/putative transposase [Acidobacteriota bacterium]